MNGKAVGASALFFLMFGASGWVFTILSNIFMGMAMLAIVVGGTALTTRASRCLTTPSWGSRPPGWPTTWSAGSMSWASTGICPVEGRGRRMTPEPDAG